MNDIRLIAAIGNQGQIGLDGGLPWGREAGDLEWFRARTTGCLVVVGHKTFDAVQHLDGTRDRVLYVDEADRDQIDILAHLFDRFKSPVAIIGGAATYRRWAPHVSKFLLTRIDYDGPADTYFPFPTPWWTPPKASRRSQA